MQGNLDHSRPNVSQRRLTITRIFYVSLFFTILSLAVDWCDSQDEQIKEDKGIFESPNYPRNYSHNLHENLSISFSALTVVRLEFLTFTLEDTGDYCKGDYVAIYKGLAENEIYLVKKKLCGTLDPSLRIIVTDPVYELLIIFHADDTESAEGFRLKYTATMVDPHLTCELMRHVHSETEEISSLEVWTPESSPSRYPNVTDCIWTIETNSSYELYLEVNLLPDMIGENCTHNFLEVRVPLNGSSNTTAWELTLRDNETDLWFPKAVRAEPGTTDAVMLGRTCGNRAYPLVYKTNANMVTVIFHSDFAIENGYFRVISRPINSTRQSKTTWIHHIKVLEWTSVAGNLNVSIPDPIPNLDLTIDTITWTIQTVPGFIIQYEITSTRANTQIFAFDGPTTDPNRKLDILRNEKTNRTEGYSSGFYLSLLCTSHSEACPRVKYTTLDAFYSSHPFQVQHITLLLEMNMRELFEYYNVFGQCCTYATYLSDFTMLISSVSSVSVRTNGDGCRYFGVVIYEYFLWETTQHGPFCEIFDGNIALMLDNFVSLEGKSLYVVVYTFGDPGSYVNTDVPVISFTVQNVLPCDQHHGLIPGPRILDYKDFITSTPNRVESFYPDYYCQSFFLSDQGITRNQTIRLFRRYYTRSWSVLCANRSDIGDLIPYLYTYGGVDHLEEEDSARILTLPPTKLNTNCNHPQLMKYYISVDQQVLCNQNLSTSNEVFYLIADQRHPESCRWYITSPDEQFSYWWLNIVKFSVSKGSGRSSLDNLTIHEYPDRITIFTNVRHPLEYNTRRSPYLHITATSEYHLNVYILVQMFDAHSLCRDNCYDGICYQLINNHSISWADANDDCSTRQSTLMKSEDEWYNIQKILRCRGRNIAPSGVTFIGLRGTNVAEGGYRWTDGSPLIISQWYQPFNDIYNTLPTYPVLDIPPEKIQPIADLDQECVAMVIGNPWRSQNWRKIPCYKKFTNASYICQKIENKTISNRETPMSMVRNTTCLHYQFVCDDGTCLSPDSKCNREDDCSHGEDEYNCSYGDNIFNCDNGKDIHVSRCCDSQNDCGDNSDEDGCEIEKCFRCSTAFYLPDDKWCDGLIDCPDGKDERSCTTGERCAGFRCPTGGCIPHEKRLDMVPDCAGWDQPDEMYDFNLGKFSLSWIVKDGKPEKYKNGNTPCPGGDNEWRCHPEHVHCYPREKACMYDIDSYGHLMYCRNGEHLWGDYLSDDGYFLPCLTHLCPNMYKCPDDYCIPYRRVCDGSADCPDLSDEADCDNYTCPGLLRCREKFCLSWDEVCDGKVHCPNSVDDERFCEFNGTNVTTCPAVCLCEGYHVDCSGRNLSSIPDKVPVNARTLILHSNALENMLEGLHFKYLVIFDLSNNNVTEINGDTFRGMRNLHHLKLHHNSLRVLGNSSFSNLSRLKTLEIQVNPIFLLDVGVFSDLASLVILNMSNLYIETIPVGLFEGLVSLKVLDLAVNRITVVESGALSKFVGLEVLNITNNTLENIRRESFNGLGVDHLLTDDYRFCCFVDHNIVKICSPEESLTFSCDHLLASHAHKALVWIIGVSAFVGNIVVLVRRFRDGLGKVPSILIFNLSISDMLMGIFLLIIASTDLVYLGDYALEDPTWRASFLCQVAGVLATLSNGMSMMMIVFIAVDRAMKVISTFGRVPNNPRRSIIAIVIGWLTIVCLSLLPFLPVGLEEFYGRTEICAPFIFKDLSGPALYYAMAFFVVPNCLALIVVTVSYISIYVSVKRSGEASGRKDKYEVDLAKKFGLIIFTDFFTWFPVLLSVIAFQVNSPLRPDESSTVALIILPLNSALNPYLYPFKSSKETKKD